MIPPESPDLLGRHTIDQAVDELAVDAEILTHLYAIRDAARLALVSKGDEQLEHVVAVDELLDRVGRLLVGGAS